MKLRAPTEIDPDPMSSSSTHSQVLILGS
ncbi:MAG: hypothetical protein RLZZ373_1023, partial [Pseudomonadota bacterium]